MKRRTFKKTILAAAAAGAGLASPGTRAASSGSSLDRFGGWKEKPFTATGFFRTEHDGQRWWIVTPEGNAFLSFGINHLNPSLWRQEFSRNAWQKRLKVEDLNDWAQFKSGLRRWFLDVCHEWGFNTVGVHNSLDVINRPRPEIAYMKPIRFVDIPHWQTNVPDENFLDVYSREFAGRCDQLAKQAAAPEDPFLLGYSMTDCPLLTDEDCRERTDVIGGARREARIGWPRRLRNLGPRAAGKAAYVEAMREFYLDDVDAFNRTYGTRFRSFGELNSAENWRPASDLSNGNETRDNVEFLKRVVAKYYETARDAIRRYDPNHLFVGDKLNGNTDSVDTVLPVTSRYTDIVMYQMYGRYEVQRPGIDRWSRTAGKPFLNGDAAFTMIAPGMPRPYGPVADGLAQRAEWTTEFFLRAFARPDFVGWHYCGLIDATQRIPRKQARQHSGLLNEMGEPYPELIEAIKTCTGRLYEVGAGRH